MHEKFNKKRKGAKGSPSPMENKTSLKGHNNGINKL